MNTTEVDNNNNHNSPTEKQQTTQPNNKKRKNRFLLTEINRRCQEFIFCSSEQPTLYSQIQPNKDSIEEDDDEWQ